MTMRLAAATALLCACASGQTFSSSPQPVSALQSGSWTVAVGSALPTGSNTIGAVTQASGPWTVNVTQLGGNTVSAGNGTAGTGTLRVTVASDSTGTLAVTQATASNLNVQAVGNIAHDNPSSGNPLRIGCKAETSLEGITAVADADVTEHYCDADGVAVVKIGTVFADIVTERISDTGGTSTAFTNFNAGGTGVRNYVTTITCWNSSATDGYVDLRDGTGGSVLFTVPCPATGGSVISLPVPLRQSTANTALAYDASAAISTIYLSVVGYQSKL